MKRVQELIHQARIENATILDLSGQELTEIPRAVFQLHQLEHLNISQNMLELIPIELVQMKRLTHLDLSANGLTRLPDGIALLTNLKLLNLGGNRLQVLTNSIRKLTNLTTLDVSRNGLTVLPERLGEMTNLTTLNVSRNALERLPESLGEMINLTALDISRNGLTMLPKSFERLTHLTKLNLGSARLKTLPEALDRMMNLIILDLSGNEFRTLPDAIMHLQNLTVLDLSFNRFTAIPWALVELTNLTTLNVSTNQLVTLPNELTRLTKLRKLDLSKNLFTEIPESIYGLQALEELWLGERRSGSDRDIYWSISANLIRTIPEKILSLEHLKVLDLQGNPIESPPPEVAFKGIDAIREYFRQLRDEGTDHLYEAKVLIIGEGGAGKTTLAKKILDPDYALKEAEVSTRGIEVLRWEFPMEDEKSFRVNIWDFGGQEIYHATHQFFLTHRSLYLLVADARNENTDFYYWLNIVELLSDNSPLLIVNNEKQDRGRQIGEPQLRQQFANLKEILGTNLATKNGLPHVIQAIKDYVMTLPLVGTPLPKTWVKVREELEQNPENYISLEEYLDICQENGFTKRADKLQLSGYLHDLGVILHFQDDPLLNKTVVLKPKWGTDAVYAALDNKEIQNNKGKFTRQELAKIWTADEYVEMQGELLQLMVNFKLCYQIPNSNEYIAPQLLNENQAKYEWDAKDNLVLRYRYEFMPKGIVMQLIVAKHKWIENQEVVWKTGVVLDWNGTRAEVMEDGKKREIRVRVSGAQKRNLMTIVRDELDSINETYSHLQVRKWIPCNCSVCKTSDKPYEYALEVLERRLSNGRDSIECEISYERVNIRRLIDDYFESPKEREREQGMQHGGITIHGGTFNIKSMVGGDSNVEGDQVFGDVHGRDD